MLFAPSTGGDLVAISGGDPSEIRAAPRGSSMPGPTSEVGVAVPRSTATADPDPEVRTLARSIAAHLLLPKPRRVAGERRRGGDLLSLPYREGGSVELDLDRTLERMVEKPFVGPEDIVVRDRAASRRAVVLALDVSGSMRGERIKTAAATVAALATELHRDSLAVIAFWSDAAVLLELGQPIHAMELLDSVLAVPARGLTNVAFPLQVAAQQLSRISAPEARVILLSDCVHNAGPDPRPLASALPRLDVLLDVSGEKDLELGRELARAGHGLMLPIRTHRDVAPAISRAFGS